MKISTKNKTITRQFIIGQMDWDFIKWVEKTYGCGSANDSLRRILHKAEEDAMGGKWGPKFLEWTGNGNTHQEERSKHPGPQRRLTGGWHGNTPETKPEKLEAFQCYCQMYDGKPHWADITSRFGLQSASWVMNGPPVGEFEDQLDGTEESQPFAGELAEWDPKQKRYLRKELPEGFAPDGEIKPNTCFMMRPIK